MDNNRKDIGLAFLDYFSQLFTFSNPIFPVELQDLYSPCVSSFENDRLLLVPEEGKILSTLSQMGTYKSPDPFVTCWHTVGNVVSRAVQHFFHIGRIPHGLNFTFIALIPKIEGATKVEQFRPIALCNVVLKMITKILANWIRPLLKILISPQQAAFVPRRNITDNTILNHELMHFLNGRKGKTVYMAMKIDIAKAYDRVEWSVINKIMSLHGFAPPFCELLNACMSIVSYSVLINGSPYGQFQVTRGIRQGDPLSPALFTILFDLLPHIITWAEQQGWIHGIKVGRACPPISHLMYADDLVVYCRVEIGEATAILDCLNELCACSDQRINFSKSSIHFSSNIKFPTKLNILRTLGMVECDHKGSY